VPAPADPTTDIYNLTSTSNACALFFMKAI
jgi:hypothetical protein